MITVLYQSSSGPVYMYMHNKYVCPNLGILLIIMYQLVSTELPLNIVVIECPLLSFHVISSEINDVNSRLLSLIN